VQKLVDAMTQNPFLVRLRDLLQLSSDPQREIVEKSSRNRQKVNEKQIDDDSRRKQTKTSNFFNA
jgi:hypothetical protein